MIIKYFLLAILVAVPFGCSGTSSESRSSLQLFPESPEKMTLLSLDGREPIRKDCAESFHLYPVLGKVEITDEHERISLMKTLTDGMARRPETGPKCFVPRLGMTITNGTERMDYVICFECSGIEAYRGDQKVAFNLINRDVQDCFDKLLVGAGIPIAGK